MGRTKMVHKQHQISSFNPSCCLRPPSKHVEEVSVGCMPRFGYARRTQKLIKSGLASSASSSSQLLKSDWGSIADEGPVPSPKVGCMGQVRRSNSRTFYASRKSAKVEDYCSVAIADTMDPPLPVPKRCVFDRDDAKVVDSLWRRRHGGDLEGLDVGQVKMQARLHLQLGFGCSRDIEA